MRVATLIDEQAFMKGHLLEHNVSVFLEDRLHDWQVMNGVFMYYSRVARVADVVVVYEVEQVERPARQAESRGS